MKTFFLFWLWLFASRKDSPDDETFGAWMDRRENARRERYIVHKIKTEWIFSGTFRNENGAMQDAGFLRSPHPMNRAQALRYFAKHFPRAHIMHVDDKNKIITYSF